MAVTRVTTQDILDDTITSADYAPDSVDADALGIVTTKGDILTFSTEPARLPVGTDGQILTADSGEATGLLWADGVSAASFIDNETPTGTINGVNDTFTLANTPVVGSEHLYKNGLRMRPGAGNDYTISGLTITMEAGQIPQTGDSLHVDYRT